jgi:hypothetical protein
MPYLKASEMGSAWGHGPGTCPTDWTEEIPDTALGRDAFLLRSLGAPAMRPETNAALYDATGRYSSFNARPLTLVL